MTNRSYVVVSSRQVRITDDPEHSEEIRRKLVPGYYDRCLFRSVLAKPYDFLTEDTPLCVECKHPVFKQENLGECLGQCAIAGMPYGKGGAP